MGMTLLPEEMKLRQRLSIEGIKAARQAKLAAAFEQGIAAVEYQLATNGQTQVFDAAIAAHFADIGCLVSPIDEHNWLLILPE